MHCHWSYPDIMHMEHPERRRWVREIVEMTRRDSGASARFAQ